MIDFLKNNKIIAGVVVLIIVLLALIIVVVLSLVRDPASTVDTPTFGDTSPIYTLTEEEQLFGTTSERWIASEGNGAPAPNLRAVTKTPVIGASVYERGGENGEQYVRFTSRTNGNIFDTPLATVGAEEKISNETVIRIGVSSWARNGETTFMQYLDNTGEKVETYLRSFTQNTLSNTAPQEGSATSSAKGRHLDQNIISATLSPRGDKIFYLIRSNEGSAGYIEDIATGKKSAVWSSLLASLTVTWDTGDMILIYPNPSSEADGVLWSLQPSTGKTRVLLGNEKALAAKANPAGTKILFSKQEADTKAFSLRTLDIATGKITQLGLSTMVDKCSWGPDDSKYVYCAIPRTPTGGSFLENWYMGLTTSDDVLWRIDTAIGITKRLLDPKEEAQETFDILDVVVSPQENYVTFRTKVSSVLWALRLPGEGGASDAQATTTPEQE